MLNKFCAMTAKSAPYPPCTGTAFWLKYLDPARMLRRVTQPPHIAGPLQVIAQKNCLTPYLDNFVALDKFLNLRQLIVKFGRNRSGNDNRLAPKSTSPQFQPFASLLFCSQDNSCMAQLTYNTRVQCITLSRYLRYPTQTIS